MKIAGVGRYQGMFNKLKTTCETSTNAVYIVYCILKMLDGAHKIKQVLEHGFGLIISNFRVAIQNWLSSKHTIHVGICWIQYGLLKPIFLT